jgi:ketosteroid isomerase-like protein
MFKIACTAALALGLALTPSLQEQETPRNACIQRCLIWPQMGDPEVQRQEIVSLEKEAAHAIQQNNGTFFRRVYSDDYTGTLSHGQTVDRNQWIQAIESPLVKYESFNASDVKVHIYQDTAIATCLWSSRSIVRGQHVSNQIRAIHVYLNTPRGWHVVSGQATNLPPDVQQPL